MQDACLSEISVCVALMAATSSCWCFQPGLPNSICEALGSPVFSIVTTHIWKCYVGIGIESEKGVLEPLMERYEFSLHCFHEAHRHNKNDCPPRLSAPLIKSVDLARQRPKSYRIASCQKPNQIASENNKKSNQFVSTKTHVHHAYYLR